MKLSKVAVLSLVAQLSLAQAVQAKQVIKTISDKVVDIQVDLNPKTVLCLVGDYSASSLKIAIPQIKYYTHLDHTSRGAPGPCINAGRCNLRNGFTDSRLPLFHDASKPQEDVKLRVIKEEVIVFNSETDCTRVYRERLSSVIRGVPFYHEAQMGLAKVNFAACEALANGGSEVNEDE